MEQSILGILVKELNGVFCMSKNGLAETKGDIHEYLGLFMDFSGRYNQNDPDKKGQVVFTIYDYIEDIVDSATPNMGGKVPDPVRSKLFTVHKTLPRLETV